MMKKLSKVMILCFLAALVSCSEEETLNNDVDVAQQELAIDLSEYQDTSYGMYKGVFSTNDSQERGVVAIEVINDEFAKAKLTLVQRTVLEESARDISKENSITTNQTIVDFQGVPTRTADGGLMIQFDGNNASFEFVVAQDGSNPTINRAVLNDTPSFISTLKENTRGAVIANPGLYSGTNTSGVAVSGAWNITFDSQADADGNTMAFTSQIIVSGLDIGSAMGNVQENCADDGTFQSCDVSGTGDMTAPIVATWSGVHTSILAAPCSQFEGTWTATGAGGGGSGTFISDQQCAPPANDECAGAEAIACGDSLSASTAAATTTGQPGEFCGTSDPGGAGIWYTYVGTADGNDVTVDLSGSTYDTKLFLYSGDCTALTCLDGDDDGGAGLTSSLTFTEEDGVTYYLYAAGFNGASGTLALNVTCVPPLQQGPPGLCDYTLEMFDSFGDGWNGATVTVLRDGLLGLEDVSLDDDPANDGSTGSLTFDVLPGEDITVIVTSGGSFPGEISFNILDPTGVVVGSGDANNDIVTGTITADCP